MRSAELVREIIGVYSKHGWKISRVLLSGTEVRRDQEPGFADVIGDAPVVDSTIDAIWFERPSKKGMMAIELRLISAEPFALFELIGEDTEPGEVARIREAMEQKAAERASKGGSDRSH